MSKGKFFAVVFLALSCFVYAAPDYPNLKNNSLIDYRMQLQIAPYLLPIDHPMKPMLDSIFSQSRVIENERTLVDAGFEIIAGPMPYSFIIVARHPMIPGYVFKIYLDSESRSRKNLPHWKWLFYRCTGAEGIRKIIKRKNIRYFLVPDKWLYILPTYPYSSAMNLQPIILMETDMEPESAEVTERMWKTGITRDHLDELYSIFKHGHGGPGIVMLTDNVPFTKKGKFAFTDTEDPQGGAKLRYVKQFISEEFQEYWDSLIDE